MTQDLDATARAQRHRFRGLAMILAGGTALAGVIACTASTTPVRQQLRSHYGDYQDDDALDADPLMVEALIVTKDTYNQVHILSYEYFHGRSIYVGYQRMDDEGFAHFAIGDLVAAELVEEAPDTSRLQGTILAPRAEVTRWFDRWNRLWSVLLWFPTTAATLLMFAGARRALHSTRTAAHADDDGDEPGRQTSVI